MRRGLHHGISLETSVSDFSGRRQARSVVGDRRRRRNLHFGIVQRQALRHAAQGPQERRQIDQARNFRRTDSHSRGTRPSWCDHGCGAGKTEPRVYYSGAWRYRHGSQRILLRRWHRDRCLRPQGWHPNPHPANARQAQPASTRFPHQQRQCLPQPPQGMAASLPWRRDEEPAQLPWLAPYSGGLGRKDHARGFYLWSDRIRPISTINAIRAFYFDWYNQDHHHVGIGLMTPNQVHYGQADAVYAARQHTLNRACRQHPERFVNKPPTPPAKPSATWINPPPAKPNRMIDAGITVAREEILFN